VLAGNGGQIGSLSDSGNVLTNLVIQGAAGSSFTLGTATGSAFSASALTTIDASGDAGSFNLFNANSNNLTIKGATGSDYVIASGSTDTISIGSATSGHGGVDQIVANGNTDTITLTNGTVGLSAYIGALGTGDHISVDTGTNVISGNAVAVHLGLTAQAVALGANDTIALSDGGVDTVFVGSNSTVTLQGTSLGYGTAAFGVNGGSATIQVTGDVTGALSSGSYALTTINGVTSGNAASVTLNLNEAHVTGSFAGGSAANAFVNMGSASSLVNALDIAASQAGVLDYQLNGHANTTQSSGAVQIKAGVGLVDWFQYGGNTYVVEAINSTANPAAHSALGTGDVVVELTGLVNVATLHAPIF